MALPTISDYINSIESPYGMFRNLRNVKAIRDTHGNPKLMAGNNSVAFKVRIDGVESMLKCYIKPNRKGDLIYSYIETLSDPLLADARLFEKELLVFDILGNGDYYDVVTAPWISGVTLETEIRRAAREFGRDRFRELSDRFNALALELLDREWAHGDLKPDNIISCVDGGLRLVDYDAMFIPMLSGTKSAEIGTPPYQHPARDEKFYRKELDDYPIAVIAVSLRALALDDALYAKYNSGDNIILHPREILANCSQVFNEVLSLFSRHGDHAAYALAMELRAHTPAICDIRKLVVGLLPTGVNTNSSPQNNGLQKEYPLKQSVSLAALSDVKEEYRVKNTDPKASTDSNIISAAYNINDYLSGISKDEIAIGNEEQPLVLFESNGLWGFANHAGDAIIPAIYEEAFEFSEGLAVVKLNGLWHAIDTSGHVAINCSDYQQVKPFSEGLAAVKRKGAWGYINTEGRLVIEHRFEMCGMMKENRALVKTSGRYGYIDSCGCIIIEARFDYATNFRNGAATVETQGKVIVIDSQGDTII